MPLIAEFNEQLAKLNKAIKNLKTNCAKQSSQMQHDIALRNNDLMIASHGMEGMKSVGNGFWNLFFLFLRSLSSIRRKVSNMIPISKKLQWSPSSLEMFPIFPKIGRHPTPWRILFRLVSSRRRIWLQGESIRPDHYQHDGRLNNCKLRDTCRRNARHVLYKDCVYHDVHPRHVSRRGNRCEEY